MGETLTADTSGIEDEDGPSNVSCSYQWLADDSDITDATGSNYTLASSDAGRAIRVKTSFTDDAGNDESLTSAATEQVTDAGPTEPPPAPLNLTAVENAAGSVTLTWDAPEDDSVTGYQMLRRTPDDGEHALSVHVADTGSAATSFIDTDVAAGTRYVYRVKAINEAGVGPRSQRVNITTGGQGDGPAQHSRSTHSVSADPWLRKQDPRTGAVSASASATNADEDPCGQDWGPYHARRLQPGGPGIRSAGHMHGHGNQAPGS